MLGVGFLFALAFGAFAVYREWTTPDTARILGTWIVTSDQDEGRDVPYRKQALLTFSPTAMTTTYDPDMSHPVHDSQVYSIDATADPKLMCMDFESGCDVSTAEGKHRLYVFERSGQ